MDRGRRTCIRLEMRLARHPGGSVGTCASFCLPGPLMRRRKRLPEQALPGRHILDRSWRPRPSSRNRISPIVWPDASRASHLAACASRDRKPDSSSVLSFIYLKTIANSLMRLTLCRQHEDRLSKSVVRTYIVLLLIVSLVPNSKPLSREATSCQADSNITTTFSALDDVEQENINSRHAYCVYRYIMEYTDVNE